MVYWTVVFLDHALRMVWKLTDEALLSLSAKSEALYSDVAPFDCA
jgi:hypothetical protein